MTVAMSSPYSSHSSSMANLSKVTSLSAVSAPAPAAAAATRNVPAGTLPPGTHLTVGKHNVIIDRWLSEGTTSATDVAMAVC
jgi:hypothetical protein